MDPEHADESERLFNKLTSGHIVQALEHYAWLPTVFGESVAIEIMSAALHDWADYLRARPLNG